MNIYKFVYKKILPTKSNNSFSMCSKAITNVSNNCVL